MTLTVTTREQAVQFRLPPLSQLDEVAETLRDDALALAREKLAPYERGIDLATLLKRPSFVDRFKYQLALRLANVLAANDERVRAVYTYDPTLNQESEPGDDQLPEPTVHLIALVEAPSASLEALGRGLDRSLTASLKALPSPWVAGCESVLDLDLVSEEDVQSGTGLARLLSAVFTPPIKIWQREA